jgi:thiol-disulfide isomerase/thioredoxin
MTARYSTMFIMLIVLVIAIPACPAQYYSDNGTDNPDSDENASAAQVDEPDTGESLPLLLDLGSTHCIPCQQMAPILEEMKAEYEGVFDVRVIDVSVDRAAGQQYTVTRIPTQIFFDTNGNELYRHIGFFSKEDMLAKWEELGYTF